MAKTAKDRDRALAMPEADAEMDGDTNMEDGTEETPEEETLGSKMIVMHLGSQNLRVGLASDALPKTIPMVIARKSATSESEDYEEPNPKRLKLDDGSVMEPEKMFGPEVCLLFSFQGSTWRFAIPNLIVVTVFVAIFNYDGRSQSAHAPE